jgi:hypothetical protein
MIGLIGAATAGASSPPLVCCSEEFRELQREAPGPWVLGASSFALGANAAVAFASLDADERSLGDELASYTAFGFAYATLAMGVGGTRCFDCDDESAWCYPCEVLEGPRTDEERRAWLASQRWEIVVFSGLHLALNTWVCSIADEGSRDTIAWIAAAGQGLPLLLSLPRFFGDPPPGEMTSGSASRGALDPVRIVPRRLDDRRTGVALQWSRRF